MIASAAVNLTVGIRDNRPIDIIVTGQSGAFDAKTIDQDIKTALQAQGVDLTRVVIDAGELTQISSEGSGAREILDTWTVFPKNAPKGQMLDSETMRGPAITGPSGQYHPTLDTDADIDIRFSYSTTCQAYSPAVLLRWSKNIDGTYTGYYVGMSTAGDHSHAWNAQSMCMYIWKSTTKAINIGDPSHDFASTRYPPVYVAHNETPQHFAGMTNANLTKYTNRADGLVAYKNTGYKLHGIFSLPNGEVAWGCGYRENLSLAPRHDYHVTMQGSTITFELLVTQREGLGAWVTSPTYVISWTDPNPIKSGSVGFFAQNSNAVGISSARYEIQEMNDLIETIRSPKWRPNSHRFILDASEIVREDFSNNIMVGELMERMSADYAYYVGWGNPTTQASVQSFIQRNEGRGTYVTGDSPFANIARYIEPIVNNNPAGSDDAYLLQGNQYDFNTNLG